MVHFAFIVLCLVIGLSDAECGGGGDIELKKVKIGHQGCRHVRPGWRLVEKTEHSLQNLCYLEARVHGWFKAERTLI